MPGPPQWLDEIEFINENTGFIIGSFNMWYKTTNQGASWEQRFCCGLFEELRSIEAIDTTTIYIGTKTTSTSSYYYKTNNGGSNWTRYTNYPLPDGWRSAAFLNADSGFFGSDGGFLIRTTTAGNNWHIAEIFSENLHEIQVIDNRIMYAVHTGSFISKSYDFGLNWIQQPYPNDTSRLNSIFMLDENTGYAVGEDGLILKTTNGGGTVGIDPISNNIPAKFTLYQNFPNPFNPETSIKFDLPKAGYTTLLVYSITGEIISELVSEHLRAGEYSVKFNALGLPSGVYFYKLETGDYSKVNKMVVVK